MSKPWISPYFFFTFYDTMNYYEKPVFFSSSMSSTVAAGDMNNLQGVQGQVTRIMRQQYGDNNDRSEYHYQNFVGGKKEEGSILPAGNFFVL